MRIIFLGLLYSDNLIKNRKRYSKGGLQMAPHTFQSNLIQGFKAKGEKVRVLNVTPIGSFPINSKKLFITKENWGEDNLQISYINLPIVKRLMQKCVIKREIKKIIEKNKNEEISIIAYGTYIPFLEILNYFKEKHPSIKNSIIVTDCVPGREDMD